MKGSVDIKFKKKISNERREERRQTRRERSLLIIVHVSFHHKALRSHRKWSREGAVEEEKRTARSHIATVYAIEKVYVV